MSAKEQKADIIEIAKSLHEKRPLYVIHDHSNSKNLYLPELQQWLSKSFSDKITQTSIKKYASVFSSDIFAEIAIQQTISEIGNIPFESKFFNDINKAKEWIGI